VPARDLPQEKLTPADELRDLLRQGELKVVSLTAAGEQVAGLLRLLDQIWQLFQGLEAKGVDLRAERSRWETLTRQLGSRAGTLVGQAVSVGGLAQLRAAEQPTPDRWWWYLDRQVQQQRRQSLRRALTVGGVVVLVLVVAWVAYQRFLAPDPATMEVIRISQRAEGAIERGDLEAALSEYQALRDLTPDDPEVHLWLGVLHQMLGQDVMAASSYDQARELVDNTAEFFTNRGMIYLQMGQTGAAQLDAAQALSLAPDFPLAYLLLGGVYEAQGRVPEAVTALETAAQLADAQGDDTLYVLIKVRLGVLMGRSGSAGP